MNVQLRRPSEETIRRSFTAAEVLRMAEAGILQEDERVELIEGELLSMAAKSIGHDRLKMKLNAALVRMLPPEFGVAIESTMQLADDTIVEPDIAVFPARLMDGPPHRLFRPDGREIVLIIELSVSTLDYDRLVKGPLSARHGIYEYWVVDVGARLTWVYRGPTPDGWATVEKKSAKQRIHSSKLPDVSIRLADFD